MLKLSVVVAMHGVHDLTVIVLVATMRVNVFKVTVSHTPLAAGGEHTYIIARLSVISKH